LLIVRDALSVDYRKTAQKQRDCSHAKRVRVLSPARVAMLERDRPSQLSEHAALQKQSSNSNPTF